MRVDSIGLWTYTYYVASGVDYSDDGPQRRRGHRRRESYEDHTAAICIPATTALLLLYCLPLPVVVSITRHGGSAKMRREQQTREYTKLYWYNFVPRVLYVYEIYVRI